MLKRLIKQALPPSVMAAYHKTLAVVADLAYGRPSSRMVVIGVTGTNGKTTTANMVARLLEGAGKTVGLATTCNFRIAGKERLNDTKMTMLGRFRLQRLLKEMADAGCAYAVVETSSEGIAQYRHLGVRYDVAVFTNLTPEHIESHGSFEAYKAAKLKLFKKLETDDQKTLEGSGRVPKVAVVNLASPHAKDFLAVKANKKFGYYLPRAEGHEAEKGPAVTEWPIAIVKAMEPAYGNGKASFMVRDVRFTSPFLGPANVENALAAIAVGMSQGIELEVMAWALAEMSAVPGRQERVDDGGPIMGMVDYAHEPEAIRKLYEMLRELPRKRTIHVVGSAGGGRDKARRPLMGKLAAEHADMVVVTNEDPYDEDPKKIIEEVAAGARGAGKKDGVDLFVVEDRGEGLAKAVALAGPGDLVLATGKGAEQWICVADGEKVRWDERDALRAALKGKP